MNKFQKIIIATGEFMGLYIPQPKSDTSKIWKHWSESTKHHSKKKQELKALLNIVVYCIMLLT